MKKKIVLGIVGLSLALAACSASEKGTEEDIVATVQENSEAKAENMVYEASEKGFASDVSVKVTFVDNTIANIEVDASGETPSIGAIEGPNFAKKIVETGNINVDAITGATFTSEAVRNAVIKTIGQAGLKVEDFQKEEAAGEEVSRLEEIKQKASELVYPNTDGKLVVSSKYGETVVPDKVERVVVIQLEDLALALDVDMVASRNFDGYYLADLLTEKNVEAIAIDESANTINLEQVLSYQPDLIMIRDNFEQSVYDELSKIAPTVSFKIQTPEVSLMAMGMALGKEDAAVQRLEEYFKKWEDTKAAVKESIGEETVALLRVMQKEIRLMPYSRNGMSSFLYDGDYLGLSAPQMVIDYDNNENLAISMELLPELDAQHILLIAGYGSASTEEVEAAKGRYAEISSDPLWQSIPAVVSGNIYEVDSRTWLTYGIIANEKKMEDLVSIFQK